MDGWEHVAALLLPLFMNWWEVRKLRQEVMQQREHHDARIAALEVRVSVVEQMGPILR